MIAYYPYLISSLPVLAFGQHAPFSYSRFIQMCQGFVPEEDLRILESCEQVNELSFLFGHPTLRAWQEFERSLRNELVKVRASRKKVDPQTYLRSDSYADPMIVHVAASAYRNPSVLEGEKGLDLQRWQVLDDLAVGHYFDLEYLITYALKLVILLRWEKINNTDKQAALSDILSRSA